MTARHAVCVALSPASPILTARAPAAPTWQELDAAARALDALIGETFGARNCTCTKVAIAKEGKGSELGRQIEDLLRGLLKVAAPLEQRALKTALDKLRNVAWDELTPEARDRTIVSAMKAVSGFTGPLMLRVGPVLELSAKEAVVAAKTKAKVDHGLAVESTPTLADRRAIQKVIDSQSFYLRNEYGKREIAYSKTAREVVSRGLEQGFDKNQIAEDLGKVLEGTAAARSEGYLRMVASVFMVRARSYSTLVAFEEAEIQEFEWSSALDTNTCDYCKMMDGKTFSVREAKTRFEEVESSEDPEEVKWKQPFVSKGKDDDGEYLYFKQRDGSRKEVARVHESAVGERDKKGSYGQTMTDSSLGKAGLSTPPAHGHCLCDLIAAGLETVTQSSSAVKGGRTTEIPRPPPKPSPPVPQGEAPAPAAAPARTRTLSGKAEPPPLQRLPTRDGVYRMELSALDGVAYTNFVPGRAESVRRGLDEGKKLPPLKLVIEANGNVDISDGNHRLRVYRERGISPIEVKFEVWRTPGSWATKEEAARRKPKKATVEPAAQKPAPAPPPAPQKKPAPQRPDPTPSFDELARKVSLTSLKSPSLGAENVNPVFTGRLGDVDVYVKPGHANLDAAEAVARHRAVATTAEALGAGKMVLPAALVKSDAALRQAAQAMPAILDPENGVTSSMFVIRAAPKGFSPAYAQDQSVLAKVRDADRLQGALVDFLHANKDRHDGNVLVDGKGRLILIDHDETGKAESPSSVFFPSGGLGYTSRQRGLADLPEPMRAYVSRVAESDVKTLAETYALRKDDAAAMKARAQSIVRGGLDSALVEHGAMWQSVGGEHQIESVVAQ